MFMIGNNYVQLENYDSHIAEIYLNRPAVCNALCTEIFDGLDKCLDEVSGNDDIAAVILGGRGHTFCSGFDLDTIAEQPEMMGSYIGRLSLVLRKLKRMPQFVTGVVHKAAIAGGCALISGCDFVFADEGAKFGYPAHRIGISAVVSLPTLRQKIGDNNARKMLLGSGIINCVEARNIGLVSHLVAQERNLLDTARDFCSSIIVKNYHSTMKATRNWMSEFDGSYDDADFEQTAQESSALCYQDEMKNMLRSFWNNKY